MTAPAPTIGNTTLPDYEDLVFPPDIPRYNGYIYPYLTSNDPVNASQSSNYGFPPETWLPSDYNDSTPQAIPPWGGGMGGNPSLWEPVLNVSASITNTGSVAGHEIAQLYVALGEGEPPKVLRGFDKLWILPGETVRFEAQLLRRDVSVWDTERQEWVIRENVRLFVGASSRDLPLEMDVRVV